MGWHISVNKQITGPYDDAMIMQLVREGRLPPDTLVARDGSTAWIPFAQSPFAAFAGAPAGTQAASGGGEGTGYVLLLLPFVAAIAGLFVIPLSPGVAFLVILLTAVFAAFEASQLGMGSKLDSKGKKGSGPVVWFLGHLLIWIFAYPWYLHERSKYGRKSLVVGGIVIGLFFVLVMFVSGH